MGAVLVCFGVEVSPDFSESRQHRKTSLLSRNVPSLWDRLQTSWSCGHFDDEDEDPINWDTFLLQSNKSTASSGSRMLSSFYSRLLEENDDCAFYFDSRGKRLKGDYWAQLVLLDDYFSPFRTRCCISPHPTESLEMYSDDCFSTSSTMVSEMDYWTSLDPTLLPSSQPVLGRCASLGSGSVHSNLKIHRAFTSPHLQANTYFAHLQSSPSSSHHFISPKSYLPTASAS